METLWGLLGTAIAAFASTNIDDLFLLTVLFATPRFRTKEIVSGQYLGLGTLVLISAAGRFGALLLPIGWTRFLGLLPVAIGVRALYRRGTAASAAELNPEAGNPQPGAPMFGANTLGIAAVTIANGGDNIAVYVPLFASVTLSELLFIMAVFAALLTIWCAAGHYLAHHLTIGERIISQGSSLVPFVLIALGLFLLFKPQLQQLLSRGAS